MNKHPFSPSPKGFQHNAVSLRYIGELMAGIKELEEDTDWQSEVAAWVNPDGLVSVYAYVHPDEETWFSQFCRLLNHPHAAPYIGSIEITGPDKGTNGTRLYDLSELLEDSGLKFSRLREFEVEQTSPIHKNVVMVSYDDFYDENGAAGRILDKMPNLRSLVLPCAPTPYFFDRKSHPLETLSLQAGYDHQGFICHLSRAECFPALRYFEWSDGPKGMGFPAVVPIQHFLRLLAAPQLSIEMVSLLNTNVTDSLRHRMEDWKSAHLKRLVVE